MKDPRQPLRIAIVTPTNRRERYLKRLIKEVRSQSLPNWTFYVVHDGPNPRMRRFMRKVLAGDLRIRYQELDHHVGNWGDTPRREGLRRLLAEEPDTDYVLFWDDDDAYFPNALECVRAALLDAELPDLLLVPFRWDPGVVPPDHRTIEEMRLLDVVMANLVLRPELAAEMFDRVLPELGNRRGEDYLLFDKIRTSGVYTIRRARIAPIGFRDGHRMLHVWRRRLRIPGIGLAKWEWYRALRFRIRSKSASSHKVFDQP